MAIYEVPLDSEVAGRRAYLGETAAELIDQVDAELALARSLEDEALSPTGVDELELSIHSIYAQEVDSSANARRFAENGYVRKAPKFALQVLDESRDMPFRYFVRPGEYRTMTEHEGLVQLDAFLESFIERLGRRTNGLGHITQEELDALIENAKSMRESATFIGWREYHEATKAIGQYWKSLLDENPNLQLCIPAEVSSFPRYKKFGDRKSDEAFREDVLLTFSDDELEEYGDRIVGILDGINRDPENVMIILCDDWSISGGQIRDSFTHVVWKHPKGRQVAARGNIEANFLTATKAKLEEGIRVRSGRVGQQNIKTKAYFVSNDAPIETFHGSQSHTSGQHSAVNYDFYSVVVAMEKVYGMSGKPKPKIALGRIEPWYRTTDSVVEAGSNGARRIDIYDGEI